MKKLILAAVLICGVFAFSSLTHAQPYASLYAGVAIPHESDFNDNIGMGISGTISFNSGASIGAKAGQWLTPGMGLQLDFNGHYPESDTMTVFGVPFDAQADVTIYSLTVNAIARYPEGTIRPYAGIGGGWYYGEIDDGTFTDEDNVFGWQLLAGVDFTIAPNTSIFGEYKYSGANFEFTGAGGVDVDYRASQVYAGVTFNF